MTSKIAVLLILTAAAGGPAALADDRDAGAKKAPDVVATAAAAGEFRTLVTALVAADLIEPLKGKGPFTVFAPSDASFAKLPAGALGSLLKAENSATLKAILTYHVVPGRFLARELAEKAKGGSSTAATLDGAKLSLAVEGHDLKVDGAKVVAADIRCGNGVIHVIDAVLMPKESAEADGKSDDIAGIAEKAGTFKTLLAALKAAGLADAVRGDGPLTVLAPTDEAFAKLPRHTLAALLKPENKDKLARILKFHVIPGKVTAREAVSSGGAQTLLGSGKAVKFRVEGGRLEVNGAKVLANDIAASNGIIHAIDTVLMPEL